MANWRKSGSSEPDREDTSGGEEKGVLYLVATPIGGLADFSHRAEEVIRSADIIACEDTRHSRILLDAYAIPARNLVSYHAKNLDRKTGELIRELETGKTVALLSDAGTPGISDPGALLVRAAVKGGIPVVPIPGPSAPVAALSASGFPTHRFIHEGFLPRKKGRRALIASWQEEERTIIFFESPMRIVKTLREISDIAGARDVCVAREVTKKFEEFIRGELLKVADELEKRGKVKGEITVVLAPPGYRI